MKRRLERLRTARLVGMLSGVSALSLLADALSPWLLHHAPAVLVLASPRSMYLLAVSHRVPVLWLVPLVTLRLCLTDPIHFQLGRRVPVRGRVGDWLHRVPRIGFLGLVAAWPVSHTMLAAGAGKACGRLVAAADLAGTAARVAFTCLVLAQVDGIADVAHRASRVGPLACGGFVFYALMAYGLGRGNRFGRGVRLRFLRWRRRHQARGVDRRFWPAVPTDACQAV